MLDRHGKMDAHRECDGVWEERELGQCIADAGWGQLSCQLRGGHACAGCLQLGWWRLRIKEGACVLPMALQALGKQHAESCIYKPRSFCR